MGLTRGLTEADAVFKIQADLEAADLRTGTTAAIQNGVSMQFFDIDTVDAGSAVPLDNALFANPVAATDPQTATNTAAISKLKGLSSNSQTGTAYTLVLTDADDGEVWMNNASANVLTIPTNAAVPFAIETVILIMMEGAGITSVTADTGVTLNDVVAGSGDLTRFNGVALKKRGTNTWIATPLTVI